MSTHSEKNSGNFSVERGGRYADRRAYDDETPRAMYADDLRRVREPAKQRFARRVREIATTWKADGGDGAYASRAVANTAHGIQWPLNKLHDQMTAAINKGVPLERVEAMGFALIEEARELHREKRRLLPAA